ncbi:MAG TPA: glycosyltransferase family 2 protein [Vicinamibacterales bacterium]|nr:glycosyltransferase family 2 protein [Vicinamibacterales bacterium]
MNAVDVSIVIPTYRSAGTLPELVRCIDEFFASYRPALTHEIIAVDDGSQDETWEAVRRLCAGQSHRRGIRLLRNFGQQNATLCGIANARGGLIVTMDDDLQHEPEDIGTLLEAKRATGADVVIARLIEKETSWFRRKASDLMRWLVSRAVGKPKGLHLSSFRLLDRAVAEGIAGVRTSYPYFPALLFAVANRVVNVEVKHRSRQVGRSNYTLRRLVREATNLIVNNSTLLLDAVSAVGVLSILSSFLVVVIVVYRRMTAATPVPGLASIIISVHLIGGLILAALGVIGHYLHRLLNETVGKPGYVVAELTRSPPGDVDGDARSGGLPDADGRSFPTQPGLPQRHQ